MWFRMGHLFLFCAMATWCSIDMSGKLPTCSFYGYWLLQKQMRQTYVSNCGIFHVLHGAAVNNRVSNLKFTTVLYTGQYSLQVVPQFHWTLVILQNWLSLIIMATRWFEMGLQLGVDPEERSYIESDTPSCKTACIKVFTEWKSCWLPYPADLLAV